MFFIPTILKECKNLGPPSVVTKILMAVPPAKGRTKGVILFRQNFTRSIYHNKNKQTNSEVTK